MMQNQRKKQRKLLRRRQNRMFYKKLASHKRDWKDRDRYLGRIKRMKADELKIEIIEQKRHLATLDVREMEHKIVDTRRIAAYKLSSIIGYLERLLKSLKPQE